MIFSTKGTNLISDVIATRQSVIQTRQTDLQAYLKAVDQGVKLLNASDAEAIKITAQKLGISEAEAKIQLAGVKIFDIEMNKKLGFNLSDSNNVLKNFDLTLKTGVEMKVISDSLKSEALYDDSIVKSL